jgi:hypothetical protein
MPRTSLATNDSYRSGGRQQCRRHTVIHRGRDWISIEASKVTKSVLVQLRFTLSW